MADHEKNEDSVVIDRRMKALEREQEQKKQRDREYKDRQLKFNKLLTLCTVGIFIVSVVAGCISFYQWREMRKATIEAHKAFAVGQRSWLGVDSGPTIGVEGTRWKVDFKVKNYGLSPALHAAFPGEIASAPIVYDVVKAKIEQACSRGDDLTNDAEGHGYTIFPGSSQLQDISIGGNHQTAIYLLGCLTYQDQFGVLHHTRFC
ncbi:MAG TPA: hypothetical protein VN223_05380 [Candidatus Elarobacter sp.]|nr:hypothetical protein [Candidatus Elarobacter sp.]